MKKVEEEYLAVYRKHPDEVSWWLLFFMLMEVKVERLAVRHILFEYLLAPLYLLVSEIVAALELRWMYQIMGGLVTEMKKRERQRMVRVE